MRNLSEALIDLAGRVKRVEDSAEAVQEKNRAALQSRREELEAAIEQSKIDLRPPPPRRRTPPGAGGRKPRAPFRLTSPSGRPR